MLLAFAKKMKKENINYQSDLLVIANDISDICVYMTYIQLSLYGIPAIVSCGEALSGEIRFKMETPFYFLQYWKFRKFFKNNVDNGQKEILENQKLFKEITIKGNTQISLW